MIVNRSVKNYIGKSVKIHLDINNIPLWLDSNTGQATEKAK